MDKEPIPLKLDHILNLKIAKVFEDNSKPVTSLDFDSTGSVFITASEDESMHVYDCIQGKMKQVLFSKKYGVGQVRFTHRSTNVIHTSTKNDDIIRYLSLHDNRYLQYFRGHKRKVVSIEMSPKNDIFLAGSVDDSVRLWDLRSPNVQAAMNVTGVPCIAFDPEGVAFAIGLNSKFIKLYSVEAYQKGPFSTFIVDDPLNKNIQWSSIKFSYDGKHILISSRQEIHYLIDAYTGEHICQYQGHVNKTGIAMNASFTPDSKHVISGSTDGTIHFWDKLTGVEAHILDGHPKPVPHVKFNPNYLMMASACSSVAMWLPQYEEL